MPIETGRADIAEILSRLANVFQNFHERDVALQNALSNLEISGASDEAIKTIQHLDLITQSHLDFSGLLQCISDSLKSDSTCLNSLRETLTLRSLKDELFDGDGKIAPKEEEVVLF